MMNISLVIGAHPELFRSREIKVEVLNKVIALENEASSKIRAVLLEERLLLIGNSNIVSIDEWYADGVKCYYCGKYNEPQRLHVIKGQITLECKFCAQAKGIDNIYNE